MVLGIGALIFIYGLISVKRKSFQCTEDAVGLAVFGISVILAGLVGSIGMSGANLFHIQDIRVDKESICIYQKRVEHLLPQVKNELDTYKVHESDIYEHIASGNGALFLSPQLKANETVMQAANEIKDANDKVYALRIDILNHESSIRVNHSIGPWLGW